MRSFFALPILLSLVFPTLARAKVVQLFQCLDHAVPVINYNSLAAGLKAGDVVAFCNGKNFTLEELAGEGNRTYIFRVKEQPGAVLRVSARTEFFPELQETVDGAKALSDLKIRHPEILESLTHQYVLAEDVGKDLFTLDDWANQKHPSISDRALYRDFEKFAKELLWINTISDAHSKNIAYSPKLKQWLILDYGRTVTSFNPTKFDPKLAPFAQSYHPLVGRVPPWSERYPLFERYDRKLKKTIFQERKRANPNRTHNPCLAWFLDLFPA